MEKKQLFFIYGRKEMFILILLGLTIALFAFTFGLHFGKRAGFMASRDAANSTHSVKTEKDSNPLRKENKAASKAAAEAQEATLGQALHEAVTKTGIKLAKPRQVELPSEPKAPQAGETTLIPEEMTTHPALDRGSPKGRFTIQVGSFKSVSDAIGKIDELEGKGMKPFLREAELENKGKWFRLYLGGFSSKKEAEVIGQRFQKKHMIKDFVVAKMPNVASESQE